MPLKWEIFHDQKPVHIVAKGRVTLSKMEEHCVRPGRRPTHGVAAGIPAFGLQNRAACSATYRDCCFFQAPACCSRTLSMKIGMSLVPRFLPGGAHIMPAVSDSYPPRWNLPILLKPTQTRPCLSSLNVT